MLVFYSSAHHDSCVTVRGASYAPNAEADKNAAEKAIAEAHKVWAKRLPKDQEKLWGWLAKKTPDDLLSLLAYCTALTVNAVKSKRGIGHRPARSNTRMSLAVR
jgi:ParB family chromosome partitioning protein